MNVFQPKPMDPSPDTAFEEFVQACLNNQFSAAVQFFQEYLGFLDIEEYPSYGCLTSDDTSPERAFNRAKMILHSWKAGIGLDSDITLTGVREEEDFLQACYNIYQCAYHGVRTANDVDA